VRVALRQASIVLVTDHSGSMQATDVSPTRLAAAQRAANTFIDQLPGKVAVGAVAFAAEPDAATAPTTDHDAARSVIDGQVADGADRLSSIYRRLGTQLGSRREKREITSAFALGALALLLGAGATSVRWRAALP